MDSLANIGIIISYVLIAAALIGLIIGVVVAVMQNWKDGGLYAVIGVVAIIVFFGIGYTLSSGEMSQSLLEEGLDAGTYRKSSAGLITFYILAIIGGVLLVVDVVKGFIDGN